GSEGTVTSLAAASWPMAQNVKSLASCRSVSGLWICLMTSSCPFGMNGPPCASRATTFRAVARLRSGVTLVQANADVERMIDLELRKFPPPKGMSDMMRDAKLGPNVRPLINDLLGDIGGSLWVIMATIGMVLLIACANVANLLLVRTEGRNHEL